MTTINTREELRIFLEGERNEAREIGLVPTMGALHEGHLSLIERAVQENDRVIVSIFVNPTQFNNPEDLEKYPQNLQADLDILKTFLPKVVVFAPAIEEVYAGQVKALDYDLGGLDQVMEGAYREGHFQGVATIVETLLRLTSPDRAYFGEKDYQQLQIIKKLVKDKGLEVTICPCPIVREPNGLAMSSRNTRLPKRLRERAGIIYQTLQSARQQFGTESVSKIMDWVQEVFSNEADFELEYFSIADANTLIPINTKNENQEYRAFIAVYAGDIRLIDNLALN
ncbi:pantoate--beta-alanine ligase [Lentiprolixibacter aurantiacus]|uniref:Pantothenate synthetase n=1 Tax=Lentiprolixibacter aurantiacus TaxID=2993939 RepID=A0AAE3MK10_9FLAO|nr:pantoate--beta-alanine ligase [Lentiprolixibacter aurantiacus]MCX2718299.1 pantoate--beta-alanine ligase [Lentiprolixibacter aurantiacus]